MPLPGNPSQVRGSPVQHCSAESDLSACDQPFTPIRTACARAKAIFSGSRFIPYTPPSQVQDSVGAASFPAGFLISDRPRAQMPSIWAQYACLPSWRFMAKVILTWGEREVSGSAPEDDLPLWPLRFSFITLALGSCELPYWYHQPLQILGHHG